MTPGGNAALIFDMDGVLVDVSGSFRRVIRELVKEWGGGDVGPDEIQVLKEQGGFNDDVKLSMELLVRRGIAVSPHDVRRTFDSLYLGLDGRPGLWREERWLAHERMLRRLARAWRMGIVTGRTRVEVERSRSLAGAALEVFECVVTQDDIPADRGKPEPDGILEAMRRLGAGDAVYVGDAVDDMRSASAAGIRAVGILPPGVEGGARLERLLRDGGAEAVLGSIQGLEAYLSREAPAWPAARCSRR